jgi:hypothetical protein
LIHKLYTLQWIALIIGLVFLLIAIYALFKGTRRDKFISIGILSICLVVYIVGELRINHHNKTASIYYGKHELMNYLDSENYSLEVLPNGIYNIYEHDKFVRTGEWELSIDDKKSPMLILNGNIFGIGEYQLKKKDTSN